MFLLARQSVTWWRDTTRTGGANWQFQGRIRRSGSCIFSRLFRVARRHDFLRVYRRLGKYDETRDGGVLHKATLPAMRSEGCAG